MEKNVMSNQRGIVYILTNPLFQDDVVKIGITKNIEERLKILSSETGVPCPFECCAAYEVDNYEEVENLLHSIYRGVDRHTDKIHLKKEFFRVNPEEAKKALSKIALLMNGVEININDKKAYSKEEIETLRGFEEENMQNLLKKASPEILSLYEDYRDAILNLDKEITLKANKLYVVFKKKSNICDIEIHKNALKIYLNAKWGQIKDEQHIFQDVSNVGHWGNGDYRVTVSNSNNFDYIIGLIKRLL